MRLNGKRALVTAAGQGIGRACAEAIVREGAVVFATDINAEALATLDGAETFPMDATDPADRRLLIRTRQAGAARDVDLYLLDRLGEFVPELIVN